MTTKELIILTGLSRQRLAQLRSGYIAKRKNKDYTIKPQLIQNVDWVWEQGNIIYNNSALEKLKAKSR